jgi:hypothetical protein
MTTKLPFILNRHWRDCAVRKASVLSLLLLCVPMSADALSLGRSRGAAIVGRSLDMSVLASLEPQDPTPESTCFSTEVFYGDTRVNGQNVIVSPLRTSPTELTLRVQSSKPIDEPFVTLYVRTTCGPSLSRKYVLLADSPSEPASVLQPVTPSVAAPIEPRLPRVTASSNVTSTSNGGVAGQRSAGVSDAASRALDRQAAREARMLERQLQNGQGVGNGFFANPDGSFASSPVPSAAAIARRKARMQAVAEKRAQTTPNKMEAKPKAKGGDRLALSPSLGSSVNASSGRLKVDLLDVSATLGLRSSAELLTQPATDEKARTQAAAMWRMINSSPQDLLRDADRLKSLEAEVRTMSELTKRQTQELGVVKADLVKAKGERFANPLVYGLGALTLASLGFGLWAWRRRPSGAAVSKKAAWWDAEEKAQADASKSPGSRSMVLPSTAAAQGKNPKVTSFSADSKAASLEAAPGLTNYAPMSSQGVGDSGFDSLAPASVQGQEAPLKKPGANRRGSDGADSGFGAGVAGGTRVNAEELFDIQQQADFFMSLGQHDQAIDVLQNHISDNLETSAVAYLDLFDIYHKVNKREEFNTLRDEFNRVFNAQVPEFEHYGLSSRGLEDYAPAMQRIQALWPSAKVLDVIEESIFRKPDHDTQPFDLAAYRELMLLYGVAKEIGEPEPDGGDASVDFDLTSPSAPPSGGPQAEGYSHTQITPLSGDAPRGSAFGQLPVNHHLGLDIDLDIFDAPTPPGMVAAIAAPKAPPMVPVATASTTHSLDNTINFDLTIDSKFMPPKKAK